MSPKRSRADPAAANLPDWSRKVEEFRHGLKLSQSELGKRLGTSTMAVSRRERGIQEVPADSYIQLGNIAGDPLCWYFWGCAGLRMEDVMRFLPAARRRLHEGRVPNLRVVHAGSRRDVPLKKLRFRCRSAPCCTCRGSGEEGDKDVDLEQLRPEAKLPAPSEWCPNPATVSLRIKGNSMSPLILGGYIIAGDTSNVACDGLLGQIVVAWNAEKGLLVSRLLRFDHTDVLVSDQREYESISLAAESDWRIIGKVLWWTGKAS